MKLVFVIEDLKDDIDGSRLVTSWLLSPFEVLAYMSPFTGQQRQKHWIMFASVESRKVHTLARDMLHVTGTIRRWAQYLPLAQISYTHPTQIFYSVTFV